MPGQIDIKWQFSAELFGALTIYRPGKLETWLVKIYVTLLSVTDVCSKMSPVSRMMLDTLVGRSGTFGILAGCRNVNVE